MLNSGRMGSFPQKLGIETGGSNAANAARSRNARRTGAARPQLGAYARVRDHDVARGALGGKLGVEDGALYHALVRLEERGSIEAEWGETENGRRARYYKLTATGRAYLRAETARWLEYASAVTGILTSPRSA